MKIQNLSVMLDELIEFGAGTMSTEAIENVFGKIGAKRNWSKAATSVPSLAGGVNPSGAQTALDKIAAAKGWGTRGVATPVGGNTTAGYLANFNAPIGAQKVAATAPAAAATISPNAAQKVAQQAGQNVAQTGVGKKVVAGGIGTGAGLAVGGAMATPDWALKQRQEQLSARLDDLIEFADPRPRNPLGEFTNQEGGPDANAMATVYKMTQPQTPSGPGISKLAGAALAGGALGSIGGQAGKSAYEGMAKWVKRISKQAKLKK